MEEFGAVDTGKQPKREARNTPRALPSASAVDKLPEWVMNHSPRSIEPFPRCRILRDVGSSSTSTCTRLNGRRRRSPRRWASTEPSLMHISSGWWHSGTWCQVSDEARLANPPSCTGSPGGKSNLAILFGDSRDSPRSWLKLFSECPEGPTPPGKPDGGRCVAGDQACGLARIRASPARSTSRGICAR